MVFSRGSAGPARARARLSGLTLRSLVAGHDVLAAAPRRVSTGNDGILTNGNEAPNPLLSSS